MAERVVKISSIIQNQLPEFIRDEFPLVQEFLSTYYRSLESQGSSADVIQNIDRYIKVDIILPLQEETKLTQNVSFFDDIINVETTYGFPDSYGLVQIDDEIITYTSKTSTTFEGCIRGFSGITSLNKPSTTDELVFEDSNASEHTSTATVKNLSILFLKDFLTKIKKQVTPGFEERQFYPDVNQRLFIKQSKDFYKSKGTDSSFKILFYALYGTPVEIIKPREYLIQPSDAQYRITKDIVTELVSGNPEELVNGTLYQDEDEFFPGARGTITHVEYISREGKDYYLIKLDYDYNKDIDVTGSIKSEFKVNPKTITTSTITSGSSYIDVDSTVGFPQSGELIIDLPNGTQQVITYQSKTFNQFFECFGINQDIPEKTEVRLNKFVYGFSSKNRTEQVRLRIVGVLSGLNLLETPYLYNKGDEIRIKTLGSDLDGIRANNWFFNVPTQYEVETIARIDSLDFIYRATLYDKHSFVIGDSFTLTSSLNEKINGVVIFVPSETSLTLRLERAANVSLYYQIKKNVSKVSIINQPELNFYNSNVQNVYYDLENSLYISSPSLPSYLDQALRIDDRSIVFSGVFNGVDLRLRSSDGILINHGFFTGDSVVYKPSNNENRLTDAGVYFVERVDVNTIRLARSRENLYNGQYVTLSGNVDNDRLELFDFNDSNLQLQKVSPQGLIRKLTDPVNDGGTYETSPGPIGIFVNGVELLNYKSENQLFYGPIERIIPTSGGTGFDIINPPNLIIADDTGNGCVAHCSVTGSLEKINIIDPGFDYLDTPIITITGGNGSGAKAKVNLVTFDHQESFNASSGVNVSTNIIEFLDYHKFRDYEEVVYDSNTSPVVPGLVSNAVYFVSVQDPYKIKLHKSLNDAVLGINPINITAGSTGIHYFKSKNKKRKIGSIEVENKGKNYKNHKTSVTSVGINTSTDVITIENHGYSSGELIYYSTDGTSVGGLSTTSYYYVTKLNDNEFRLSLVTPSSPTPDFLYRTGQYVDLTSTGSGTHYFNYKPIEVKVEGRIGVSTVGNINLGAIVQPVFRGSIDSVHIENKGINYGSDEILNYNKQPNFTVNSGFGAQLTPIILDGRVVDVVIQSSGSNYEAIPDLIINGSGQGCVLTPVLSNGTISEVKIISSGFGYESKDTTIEVVPYGTEAKFEAQIRSWRVNLVEKNLRTNRISVDDGEIYPGISNDFGLQYTHLYAARPLRASVRALKFDDGKSFLVKDLQVVNGLEVTTGAHSPIIGWAYDGNPIYGPYGFSAPSGGSVRLMRSGYALKTDDKLSQENRPPSNKYPVGFFVEDYEFISSGDLDEYNGRFCITPEYPNGVYAYFSTINPESLETSGAFRNYRKPVFPYVVGNKFKSRPIEYNLNPKSNQANINLNELNWVRNTTPYNILESRSGYDYIVNPNQERDPVTNIRSALTGSVENIDIIASGEKYKVKDQVVFENQNTGKNVKAEVATLKGASVKKISVESIEINDIPLIANGSYLGITTETAYLRNNDVVRITTPFEYDKEAIITIKPAITLTLTNDVNSVSTTGIITDFNVTGIIEGDIFENDLYEIENEVVKILSVNSQKGKILVQRNVEGFVGITSYRAGTFLVERQNKFITNLDISTPYNLAREREIYFNAEKSVGLGTTFGVGISSTLFLNVISNLSQVAIETGTTTKLYFDRNSDATRYSLGNYIQLTDSTDVDFNVNKSKVVGIGNTFITIDFDSSALSVGAGVTSYVNGWNVENIPTRAIKIENHNLRINDVVYYNKPENGLAITVLDPNTSTISNLPESQSLYVYPFNNNLIGISTQLIDSTDSLLMFETSGSNDLGIGDIHSFQTIENNTLKVSLIKSLVTVETETDHNLELGDSVSINCKTGITTTLAVKYNLLNRRFIVDGRNFVSGDVNIANDSINIENHGFRTGEKVIHESSSPCGGLENQKIYYVIVVDNNNIKLATSLYEAKISKSIDITTQSLGKLSSVNPYIKVTKYSKIRFDLSDSTLSFIKNTVSYPAFELALYTDRDFKNKYVSSQITDKFEVKSIGIVGVSSDAALEITFNENVPEILYYKLNPINLRNNTQINLRAVVDDEQFEYNKIELVDSKYSGTYRVIDSNLNPYTFKYTLLDYPERPEYTSANADITYTTNSLAALGPINSIKLLSGGNEYSNLPTIKTIISNLGTGGILEPESKSIGRFGTYDIQDIGFDYSVDYTIRPKAKLPEIIKVEPLSIFESIDVTYIGKNYNDSPDLIVLDGSTQEPLREIQLEYSIPDRKVDIIVNANGFNNITPIIIPVNNTNGYEIENITFNPATKNVTLELTKEFSDQDDFPFTIGERILIENVSVATTQRGYNSVNYNYALFTIIDLDANIGSSGATISYSLADNIGADEIPGTYDKSVLRGIVVPESHFPRFDVKLAKRQFSNQEVVISGNIVGNVVAWDEVNEILKVSTNNDFIAGNVITGQTSGTRAIIKEVTSFDAFYNVGSASIVKSGWNTQTGFLNNEFQRLHDSDYYQYFSYLLKSNVSFDKWQEPVESLNHTAGFKKFSDLIVESTPVVSGISTDQNLGSFEGIAEFYSVVDTNCVVDFDLVRENFVSLNGQLKSNEIYFENKILQDYIESFGNRVLMIDDISPQFNSNPRATRFSIIDTFNLEDDRYKKYFIHVINRRFTYEAESTIVSFMHDGSNGYINQYAKMSTDVVIGDYDFSILGTQGNLLFYPVKYEYDNYILRIMSLNIDDAIGGSGQLDLGDVAKVKEYSQLVPENATTATNAFSIDSSFRTAKALIHLSALDGSFYEVDELNIIHDGTNAYVSEYGQLTSDGPDAEAIDGFGTYDTYISGGNLVVDVIPNVSYASTVVINSLVVCISDENSTGIGTTTINKNTIESASVSIASSASPIQTPITSYSSEYRYAYFIVSVTDTTNTEHQTSELVVLNNETNNEVYYTEFGVVETDESLGKLSAGLSNNNVEVYFKPNPNIACEVRLFGLFLGETDKNERLNIDNASISVNFGFYRGTKSDVKKSFELTHKTLPIFERVFNSEDLNVVDIENNKLRLPENYFVTGEEITYVYDNNEDVFSPIGIQTTTISGIGLTDKLPEKLYVIKLNDLDIQVAAAASLALASEPIPLVINQVGVGTIHKLVAKKQNTKCLVSIDNIIQSPVAGSPVSTNLSKNITLFDNELSLDSIENFYGGELIQVNNEIMRILAVGIGSTNVLAVEREIMGTGLSTHLSGEIVTKITGNYNIVDNVIHFLDAPYGKVPQLNPSGRGDEVDYRGLEVSSTFSGRVFLRSGVPDTSLEPYSYNYVFDDISDEFDGFDTNFNLKSGGQDVVGVSTGNAVVLINSVFQLPERNDGSVPIEGSYDLALGSSSILEFYDLGSLTGIVTFSYDLGEVVGVTTDRYDLGEITTSTIIEFIGNPIEETYDVNTTNLPRGGIIISVGSTEGFGYQPLVAAGGTAIVSSSGTIESISIGYSGSGYRVGVQTFVQVGVQTESTGIPNIEYVGIASILNGHVVDVTITNPGAGYTFTDPPIVVFDEPLSYSNLPLVYGGSTSGPGVGAVVDVVVGQGSSVILFDIRNSGFAYRRGDVLTVGYGGTTGIPLDDSLPFREFQIVVTETENDDFSGWHFGDLQVLDPIDDLFDGERKSFPIKLNGLPKTIRARVGSNIDVQATLLVFINDILQVPGESYTFKNGSVITFKEAPKGAIEDIEGTGDTSKILFYRGTAEIDTIDVDILETVKVGDKLTINSDISRYQQTERTVEEIKSTDIVGTNLYSKYGVSNDETLVRPVKWCRQTEDIFINGEPITKDRTIYEPLIQPTTNVIRNVSVDSTEIFVESVKTFFDNYSELNNLNNKIVIVSQDTQVSASATAIVSVAGTVTSIIVNNGGIGYSTNPKVSIGFPESGVNAEATALVTSGIVTSIVMTNVGSGYTNTNPPQVLIEHPSPKYEVINKVSYDGDFGKVVAISTTSVGVASTGLVLDFFVPPDSFLRDPDINAVGVATTGISGIELGYYFTLRNTNIGSGVTALDSSGNVIGIGTTYLDGIYQAVAVSYGTTEVLGIGVTNVTKVTISLEDYNGITGVGFSDFYGEYSWGRIYNLTRKNRENFVSYINGIAGIETSPVVQRVNPLKYRDYQS